MTRIAGDLGVRAFLLRRREPRARVRDMLLVAGLLALGWVIVILSGGSQHVTTHWFYLPILLAAVLLGPLGTLLTALGAAIIAGPVTPADVQGHVWESPALWVARSCFFVGIGLLVSWLVEPDRGHGIPDATARRGVDPRSRHRVGGPGLQGRTHLDAGRDHRRDRAGRNDGEEGPGRGLNRVTPPACTTPALCETAPRPLEEG